MSFNIKKNMRQQSESSTYMYKGSINIYIISQFKFWKKTQNNQSQYMY